MTDSCLDWIQDLLVAKTPFQLLTCMFLYDLDEIPVPYQIYCVHYVWLFIAVDCLSCMWQACLHESSTGGPNASIVSTTKVKWSRNELAQTLSVLASGDDIVLRRKKYFINNALHDLSSS